MLLNSKIVTIHQPEHLVWLGLLAKIKQSNIFVVLDTVQYRKNYFQNRNKIKTKNGWTWLTVPIVKHSLDTKIKDIKISYNNDWQSNYLKLIEENYSKAPFFQEFFPLLKDIILKKYIFLSDLNLDLIKFILKSFGIKNVKIIKSSDLNLPQIIGSTQTLFNICKYLKADVYLSGPSGKDYLELEVFHKANIDVVFHEYNHPVYKQFQGEFIKEMSALDALFNLGGEAKNLI